VGIEAEGEASFSTFVILALPLLLLPYATRYYYVFSFVVLVSLCYNLVEGARTVEPNLYDMLGVNAQTLVQTVRQAIPS
jgi:hypothetical protein